MDRQQHLYDTAFSFIGKDASPRDLAPDEYGCAETVSGVIQAAFPELRFPTVLSTRELFAHLNNSPSFQETDNPNAGCIIISVTGTGNGRVGNGHTGIIGEHEGPDDSLWVMSNDSRTGTWEVNYTLNSWYRYYELKGGMAAHYFRPV
jgi:hypothetical protein